MAWSSLRLTISRPSRNVTSPGMGTLSGPTAMAATGSKCGDASSVAINLELDRHKSLGRSSDVARAIA